MERFWIGFFGTLLVVGAGLGIMAVMIAVFYYLGTLGGLALIILALATFAGVMNYAAKPEDKKEAA